MPPATSHKGEAAGIRTNLEIGAPNQVVSEELPKALPFQDQGAPGVLDRQAKDPARPAANQVLDANDATDGVAGPLQCPLDLLGAEPLHPEGVRAGEAVVVPHPDDGVKVGAEDIQGIFGGPARARMVEGGIWLPPEGQDLAAGPLDGPGCAGILARGPAVDLARRGGPEMEEGAGVLLHLVDGICPRGDGHGLHRLAGPALRDLVLQDAEQVLFQVHHVHSRQASVHAGNLQVPPIGLPLQIHRGGAVGPHRQRRRRRPRLADQDRVSPEDQLGRLPAPALGQDASSGAVLDREAAGAGDPQGRPALRHQDANGLRRGDPHREIPQQTHGEGRLQEASPRSAASVPPHRRPKSEKSRVTRMLSRMLVVRGK